MAFEEQARVSPRDALHLLVLLCVIWSGAISPRVPLLAWPLGAPTFPWAALGVKPEDISHRTLALAHISRLRISPIAIAAGLIAHPSTWLAASMFVAIAHDEPRWRPHVAWVGTALGVGVAAWDARNHDLPATLQPFITTQTFPIGSAPGRFRIYHRPTVHPSLAHLWWRYDPVAGYFGPLPLGAGG